jgi:hypothetical protein
MDFKYLLFVWVLPWQMGGQHLERLTDPKMLELVEIINA